MHLHFNNFLSSLPPCWGCGASSIQFSCGRASKLKWVLTGLFGLFMEPSGPRGLFTEFFWWFWPFLWFFLCFVLHHANFGPLSNCYSSVSLRIEVASILFVYYCTNCSLNVSWDINLGDSPSEIILTHCGSRLEVGSAVCKSYRYCMLQSRKFFVTFIAITKLKLPLHIINFVF